MIPRDFFNGFHTGTLAKSDKTVHSSSGLYNYEELEFILYDQLHYLFYQIS